MEKYPTAIPGRESTPINNKIACRRILLTVSHSIPSNHSPKPERLGTRASTERYMYSRESPRKAANLR
jgi:hypothetical protein